MRELGRTELSAAPLSIDEATGVSRRLRIAVVTPELHSTGGTERATLEIVDKLALAHQVCLFAHLWVPDGTPNICFHRVPVLPWPGIVSFLSFFSAASLAVWGEERRHGRFDAVYSPGANCLQVQVATAWFCQARQLDLYRSGKHRPRPASWLDWLKLAHRWSFARITSEVERRFYRSPRLERVVSESHLLARNLAHYYGVSDECLTVAHAGVNATTFQPEERLTLRPRARRELGLAEGQFVFFFIGNDWFRKGLYHVMRALAEVPEALLYVVGADVERTESWQRYSRQIGVADRVRYLSRRPDVQYFYAAADALAAPSVDDPFALMPLEAMACGLPVIISRQTGVAEIVGAEDALVVSNAENTPELVALMQRMARDSALRARLVENGLRLARQNSWDRIHLAVVKELLAVAEKTATRNG